MKVLRNSDVRELNRVLREARDTIRAKDELLTSAVKQIAQLQDALLTEKRCHMTVAAAAAHAFAEGVDLRAELDEIALSLQSDIARLEEWFISE